MSLIIRFPNYLVDIREIKLGKLLKNTKFFSGFIELEKTSLVFPSSKKQDFFLNENKNFLELEKTRSCFLELEKTRYFIWFFRALKNKILFFRARIFFLYYDSFRFSFQCLKTCILAIFCILYWYFIAHFSFFIFL